MSIGGNPPTPGSITLDNTVEHAKWKSSSNATPQDITTIRLNGTTIWNKPDLQIVQNNLSYNHETEKVTISVTRPTLINSWKYKINSGSLSSAQTSNSISISRSSFNNGQNNTVTVYGYRDGVLKGNSVAKTIMVNQDNTLSGTATWNRNDNKASLSVTLGSSLNKWTYQVDSGSQVNGSGTTASITDTSNGAKTVTFRGLVNSTQKNSTTASYTVAVPSISCTVTGGQEEITISITRSNHISTDKWQYKIDSGSWQTGAGIGTTSKTVTGVTDGTRSVQVRLQNSGGTVLATSSSVSVEVESATPAADIPSNYTITLSRGITSGSVVPYKSFPLNRGTDNKWVICYTVPLPKPSGFTAGSGSVGVEVDWNHVGNTLSSDPNNGGVYLYSGSGVASTITMTNGDISKSYINTTTSSISGVPSVFSEGQKWYKPKYGEGYYMPVSNAKITYTHPYNMLWYATSGTYSAGRTSYSGLGKLVLIPFYDYDNDTPAIAYIGDGAFGKNLHSWAMHYYITRNQANFTAPNTCWRGQKVTLHPGGNDPHWNHTQYGITQRNPGGHAS